MASARTVTHASMPRCSASYTGLACSRLQVRLTRAIVNESIAPCVWELDFVSITTKKRCKMDSFEMLQIANEVLDGRDDTMLVDIVAEVQTPDDARMLSVTYDKIRVIGGIRDTHTMFCLKV